MSESVLCVGTKIRWVGYTRTYIVVQFDPIVVRSDEGKLYDLNYLYSKTYVDRLLQDGHVEVLDTPFQRLLRVTLGKLL